MSFEFHVIDKQTGEVADMEQIALTEDWAKGLIYCDMEAFAIQSDGTLILMDECGQYAYCPADRFEVVMGPAPVDTDAKPFMLDEWIDGICEKYGLPLLSKEQREKSKQAAEESPCTTSP